MLNGMARVGARMRNAAIAALLFPLASVAAAPSGEHLAYTVGGVRCHHQTHRRMVNAPPLTIVWVYSLPEFRRLMKTGGTRGGRKMLAGGSIMGGVAQGQFAHFTEEEWVA